MSLFNWSNDNAGLFFDAYYTAGGFTSSDAGSNFLIYKFNDQLQFSYNQGTAPGSVFTRQTAFFIQPTGFVQFNNAVGCGDSLSVQNTISSSFSVSAPRILANNSGGSTIAGATSRLISSAPVATEWIATFNATDTTTGARGVIFTRSGTIIGAVRYDAGAVSYLTSSDYRLKTDIAPYGCGLGIIRKLKPCKYKWKENNELAEGFIAHELQEVLPSSVYGEKDGLNEDGSIDPQSIDKTAIIAPLVAAVQQLDKATQQQEARGEELESRVQKLEQENEALKQENEKLKKAVDALSGFDVLALSHQVATITEALRKRFIL
jgi:hypothetical protein